MSGWTILLAFTICAALGGVAFVAAPKRNRTVWRSSLLLTLAACWLMWAITYLAQLHPLIAPRSQTLRRA